MKKFIIASALASSALTGTAYADGTGPYITIEGGAVKQERADVNNAAGFEHSDRFKTGWEAGGALGYDFGHFRLEAEGFYNRSVLREQNWAGATFTQSDGLSGHTNTVAGMGNVLFGLGHWGGIKAYVGGGVGYARTHLVEMLPDAGQISDHAEGFAWQGLAGLTVPISHNVDLGVRYRYFRPDGADHFTYSDGSDRQVSLRSHSLLASLTVNFGNEAVAPAPAPEMAPPPPPPPAPPPPPPPAPIAAVCNKGPFITFFDWDKADVSPEAASILDSAIQAYGNCGTVPIMLAGYTDSSGSPKYNLGLAARRDAAVEGYLTGHGEANQRVPTADGVRELQNRRVEINYGPGSGN